MKAGKVLRDRHGLAELGDQLAGGVEGRVLCRDAADQFDELHARHRIHEMDADEMLRPVGDRGEPGDRDRRRVGRKHAVGLQHRAELGEDLALDVLVLRRRLDHEIAIGKGLERSSGRPDPVHRLGMRRHIDLLALDLAGEMVLSIREAPSSIRSSEISLSTTSRPASGADLRDAGPHLARADNADFTNIRHETWSAKFASERWFTGRRDETCAL